ncbi:MAG: glycosyltransferase family 9 protein [bacterium]
MHQIVPKELLKKSTKILFIGGVAIGDFSYLHNYFKALHEMYPNLKIDLWNDEYRGKSCLLRWKIQKHDIVNEWLESCHFFNKIYQNVGAWWNMPKFFNQLRQENYPIVVCLFNIRPFRTATFAKLISPHGFVVPAVKTVGFDFVSDSFAYIFKRNFGVEISDEQKKLSFEIDKKWMDDARAKLLELGIHPKQDKIIFLNSFAKNKKRCWDIDNVIELIKKMKSEEGFSNLSFVVNALPEKQELIRNIVKNNSLKNVYVFTASKSFFELPAIISLCDLVISVDTSIVHLAFALNIPLLGLLRQQNTVWAPKSEKSFFVFTKNKKDWVGNISVNDVFNGAKELYQKILF